jgi:hypothetical protein
LFLQVIKHEPIGHVVKVRKNNPPQTVFFCGTFPFFGKVWTCFFHGDSRLPCLTWLGFYQRSGWHAAPHWDGGAGGHFRNTQQLSSAKWIRKTGLRSKKS